MRKFIVIGVISVIGIALLVLDILYYDNLEIPYRIERIRDEISAKQTYGVRNRGLIDFQLHERYEVDTSGYRRGLNVVDGTPFTHFFQVRNLAGWKFQIEELQQLYPNFPDLTEMVSETDDFQGRYLAISFGREIVEIRRSGWLHYEEFPVAVTFSEEHHGDVMFLYLMDEMPFRLRTAHEFYIMNGSKRIFIEDGLSSLNQRNR
jgi:hypothetical protein